MSKAPAFRFQCGYFGLALTAEKYIVPGSKETLRKSLLPNVDMNDAAGFYILTVIFEDTTVYKSKVHVLWVSHPKEPEPFLAFTCDDPDLVAQSLRVFEGKRVDLEFELPK